MIMSTLVLAVADDSERLTPHAKLRLVSRVASPLVASERLPQHLFASQAMAAFSMNAAFDTGAAGRKT
jgi:hypothetical protein